MTFKDKGIVIREYAAGEHDKRLTVLLSGRGRVTVYAKGAVKPSGKLHASAQPFAFSEFVLFEGKGFLTVTQCQLIENFYGIREDFVRLCCAGHVLELADKMIFAGMACDNELRLIFLALRAIERAEDDITAKLRAAAFELKFFQLEGFSPVIGDCAVCRKPMPDGGFFYKAGMVCGGCSGNAGGKVFLSRGAAFAAGYILNADMKDIFKIGIERNALEQLTLALSVFRREYLDAPLKSIGLLDGFGKA